MIDTNDIAQITQAAPAAQQALTAWNAVAVMIGGAVVHGYHLIVSGGGLKNVIKKFWNGETKGNP